MKLIARVKEIRGNCAVFSGNEKIVMEGAEINLKETDKICIHALSSLLHFMMALRAGVGPEKLGLAKKGNKAYIQCPDPGEPYTEGGTVIFEIEVIK
ncbi:MAG: TIGR04076 family protein [Planctomycetota bacterium]|nr:MAG: TIGR04076 family protein [Planctomycetota bacterium]